MNTGHFDMYITDTIFKLSIIIQTVIFNCDAFNIHIIHISTFYIVVDLYVRVLSVAMIAKFCCI